MKTSCTRSSTHEASPVMRMIWRATRCLWASNSAVCAALSPRWPARISARASALSTNDTARLSVADKANGRPRVNEPFQPGAAIDGGSKPSVSPPAPPCPHARQPTRGAPAELALVGGEPQARSRELDADAHLEEPSRATNASCRREHAGRCPTARAPLGTDVQPLRANDAHAAEPEAIASERGTERHPGA